jgi:hypothetical protein
MALEAGLDGALGCDEHADRTSRRARNLRLLSRILYGYRKCAFIVTERNGSQRDRGIGAEPPERPRIGALDLLPTGRRDTVLLRERRTQLTLVEVPELEQARSQLSAVPRLPPEGFL